MKLMAVNRTKLWIAAAVIAYAVSVVVNLGYLELAGEEPRRVMVSVEMFESGNYIKPALLGWDYYNKPPLFNWILAFFIWITGSASELVVRLPSLIFFLLMAYFHYLVAKHFLPSNIALLSGFFILTCGDVYFYGLANGAEIDLFYGLIVYLQAVSIFWYCHQKKFLHLFLASYLFCAVGFLTKGFPSVLFQVLTLLALCVYARSVKILFNWQHLVGLLLCAGLIFFYFFLYSQYSSPYRYLTNLLNEAFLKSAIGERYKKLPEKAAMYPLLFLKMLFPWSLLLLLLFKKIRFRFWQNPLVHFSLLFILLNLWVYWFTGQPKIRYVYMFLPFACTVLAFIYYRFVEQDSAAFERLLKPFGFVFPVVLFALGALVFLEKKTLVPAVLFALAFLGLAHTYFWGNLNRLGVLIAGIILIRLTYAALFIPFQYKGVENFQAHVQKIIEKTRGAPIYYKAATVTIPVSVKNFLFHYSYDTVQIAPVLSYQIPYYYYLYTGFLMKLDTVAAKTAFKFSYDMQLKEKKIDSLYSFFDSSMNGQALLYK
jgi:4-amino-4-deoxy-L-arabinose transferase-like glycosyltransferase